MVGRMFGMSMDLHAALTRTDNPQAAQKINHVITGLDQTIANVRTVMLRPHHPDQLTSCPDVPCHTTDRGSDPAPVLVVPPHPHISAALGEDVRTAHLLTLDEHVVGRRRCVTVVGEIDLATTPLLRSYLGQQLDKATSLLVIDLRGVAFVDAGGIAALVDTRRAAQHKQIPLQLIANSHAVLRPLHAAELTDLFDIHPDFTDTTRTPPAIPAQKGPRCAAQP